MILSANQPYFSPYPGFFYRAHLSDIFVLLDTVQFPQGTNWVTRNRFKNHQGALWITVPVWKKGLGLQSIDRVKICHEGRWARKHVETLKNAYKKAPYFKDHLEFIERVFSSNMEKIADLNLEIIRYLLDQLHIETTLVLLSELNIEAQGDRLLIELCQRLGASHFLAQKGAKTYLNAVLFQKAGIALEYFSPPSPIYPQLWGSFIPNLSTFDLVFNCGPKAHDIVIPATGQRFEGSEKP
jgi:hypothetical protein